MHINLAKGLSRFGSDVLQISLSNLVQACQIVLCLRRTSLPRLAPSAGDNRDLSKETGHSPRFWGWWAPGSSYVLNSPCRHSRVGSHLDAGYEWGNVPWGASWDSFGVIPGAHKRCRPRRLNWMVPQWTLANGNIRRPPDMLGYHEAGQLIAVSAHSSAVCSSNCLQHRRQEFSGLQRNVKWNQDSIQYIANKYTVAIPKVWTKPYLYKTLLKTWNTSCSFNPITTNEFSEYDCKK